MIVDLLLGHKPLLVSNQGKEYKAIAVYIMSLVLSSGPESGSHEKTKDQIIHI